VDVRVISATNRDLEEAVEDGVFRKDLYYRLAVVPIHLPTLQARREEIPELAQHLLRRHASRLGVKVEGIDPEAMEILLEYPWPGNIRELENVLERALVLTEAETVSVEDLPEAVRRPPPDTPGIGVDADDLSVKKHGARLEKHLIELALDRTGGNKTQAADLLELSPRALRYKIQEYGIAPSTVPPPSGSARRSAVPCIPTPDPRIDLPSCALPTLVATPWWSSPPCWSCSRWRRRPSRQRHGGWPTGPPSSPPARRSSGS
jgi:DNA-binding NtrC family response regulator